MGQEVWDDLWANSRLPEWDELSESIFQALLRETGWFAQDFPEKKVLEAGAGSGRISARLAQSGTSVYLVDYSPEAITLQKHLFQEQGLSGHFFQADIRRLPFEDSLFDLSWSSGVIEHYDYQEQLTILRELTRVTKPGGLVISIVPSTASPFYSLGKWWAEKSGQWPYGKETPMTTFAPHAREIGLELVNERTIAQTASLHFLHFIPGSTDFTTAIALALKINPNLRSSLPGYLLVSTMRVPRAASDVTSEMASGVAFKAARSSSCLPGPLSSPGLSQGTSPAVASVRGPFFRSANGSPSPTITASYLIEAGYSDVVCFASVDWNFLVQRPQHMMRGLKDAGLRVIYINSTAKILRIQDNPTSIPKDRLSQLIFSQFPRFIKEVEPGIMTIDLVHSVCDLAGHTVNVVKESWEMVKRLFSLDKYVAWLLLPRWFPVIEKDTKALIVYDCVDEHSGFDPSDYNARCERQLLAFADAVFVTSQTLLKSKRIFSNNIFYLPNGVHPGFFRGKFPVPHDLKTIPHPRLGFVGALSSWIDIDLLRKTALDNPHWSFVIIGPHYVDIKSLSLPNVHFLGSKPYDQLPAYYQHLDVGLIPFKTDDILAINSNPIKAYEYIAAGLPVVSTDIPAVRQLSSVVKISDRSGFAEAIREALDPRQKAQGVGQDKAEAPDSEEQRILSKYDWRALAETACSVMASKVARSMGEYDAARHMLAHGLPKAIDKAKFHEDMRLYRRLKSWKSLCTSLPKPTPLRISSRLPYCMLMFPDWKGSCDSWVRVLQALVKAFRDNNALTLALRADPSEVSLAEAVKKVSEAVSQVESEETNFTRNMVLINDSLRPEQIDELLLAVDSVVLPAVDSVALPAVGSVALSKEDSREDTSSGSLFGILNRSRQLGVTILKPVFDAGKLHFDIDSVRLSESTKEVSEVFL